MRERSRLEMLLMEFLPEEAVQIMPSSKQKRNQVATFIQLVLQQKKWEAQFAQNGHECIRCEKRRT